MPRLETAWDVVLPNDDHLIVMWKREHYTTPVWGDEPEGIVTLAAEMWPGATMRVKRDMVMVPLRVLRAILAQLEASE